MEQDDYEPYELDGLDNDSSERGDHSTNVDANSEDGAEVDYHDDMLEELFEEDHIDQAATRGIPKPLFGSNNILARLDRCIQCIGYWLVLYPFSLIWYRIIRRQHPYDWRSHQTNDRSSFRAAFVKFLYRNALRVCSVAMIWGVASKAAPYTSRLLDSKYLTYGRRCLDDNTGVIMTIRENVPFFRSGYNLQQTIDGSRQIDYDAFGEVTDLSSLLFLLGQKVLTLKHQHSGRIFEADNEHDLILQKYEQIRLFLEGRVKDYLAAPVQRNTNNEEELFENYAMYLVEAFDDVLDTDSEKQLLKRLVAKDIEYLRQYKTYRQYLDILQKEIGYSDSTSDDILEIGDESSSSLPSILDVHGIPVAVAEIKEALWRMEMRQHRKVNFASAGLGAYVLYPLTSDTFDSNVKQQQSRIWKGFIRHIIRQILFGQVSYKADRIIQNSDDSILTTTRGTKEEYDNKRQCWHMVGSEGNVSIALAESIVIQRVSITFTSQQQHQLQQGGLGENIYTSREYSDWSSAPRSIELFGINNHPVIGSKQPDLRLLGRFEYEYYSGSNETQTYDLMLPDKVHDEKPFRAVMIRILSNHGNPNYTKLCKVGIYGTPFRKHVL